MELKDYTTEELRAEIKRRYSLVQAEKAKIKRCRHCSHWEEISCFGEQPNKYLPLGLSRCCRFLPPSQGNIISVMLHRNQLVNILKRKEDS